MIKVTHEASCDHCQIKLPTPNPGAVTEWLRVRIGCEQQSDRECLDFCSRQCLQSWVIGSMEEYFTVTKFKMSP